MTDPLESPPERYYPPGPQPGELIGHVGVTKRHCKDGSWTLYLQWRQWSTNRGPLTHRLRLCRTGPSPTKRDLRNAITQARVQANTTETYLREGRAPMQGLRRYPLRDAMANYLDCMHKQVGESTYARQESRLLHFVNWHHSVKPDVQSVAGVTADHVRAYLAVIRDGNGRKRALKDCTLRLALSDLAAMFSWCETRDWCRGNPASAVRSEMGPNFRRRQPPVILANTVVREICRACPEAAFLFCTGLRVGDKEAGGALWSWLDLEHGLLVVPEAEAERTKIHGRTIPLGTRLLRMLGAMRKGDGLIFPGIQRIVRKRMRKHPYASKTPTPHDARRWFSTALKTAKCPEADALYMLGHAQKNNMGPYYGFHPEETRRYVNAVDQVVFR